jgi:hypothetical protein
LIIVKRKRYGGVAVFFVVVALLITLFYFFTEGTRHKFCGQIVMFTVAFCYFQRLRPWTIAVAFTIAMGIMFLSAKTMLAFRQVGFAEYMKARAAGAIYQQEADPLFVDHNLISLGRIVTMFPEKEPYLGWDVFYFALIRPVPRALWPDKPVGIVESMTEALQEEGSSLTYSITYVGEAWLAYGMISVIATSIAFGLLAAWWNRFGTMRNSDLGLLIYASGFLGLVISMRSLMVFTTFILPTLFLMLAAAYFVGEVVPNVMGRRQAGQRSPHSVT